MSAIASQITNLTFVYSTVYSDTDETKHQSSASLAFVRVLHRWLVNSPHEGPVTRKMFPFDDVIMILPDGLFLLPGYAMSHKYSPVFVIVFKIVIQCILIFLGIHVVYAPSGLLHWRWVNPWWRHQMETFSALPAICAGNSPVPGEFPTQGQWRGALMFTLNCAEINGWVNNREAGDLCPLWRHRNAYDCPG